MNRRRIVPVRDIIDVNADLEGRGIAAKVHLHDACGRQTLSLEALDGSDGTLVAARDAVQEFLSGRGIAIEFEPVEGIYFWAV